MAEAKTEKKAKTKSSGKEVRVVSESKKKLVKELAEKMKKAKTILVASIKGLPSSQFHAIKKKLRGKAEIIMAKKSIVTRAIDAVEKGALFKLKENILADVAVFLSDMDAFELSGLLTESESPAKAKTGDIATEDISIEAGPTELVPGPAISELSSAGLKVIVENGKLSIRQSVVVAKAGEKIKENVANVLSKLGVMPMKVGFEPVAAYDAKDEKIYVGIKIDKKLILEELRNAIVRAMSFAVNRGYVSKDTIGYIIGKAGREENILSKIIESKGGAKTEEKKEEIKEKAKEEKVNDTTAKEGTS
jgi:large subunit ribosomal protein L10